MGRTRTNKIAAPAPSSCAGSGAGDSTEHETQPEAPRGCEGIALAMTVSGGPEQPSVETTEHGCSICNEPLERDDEQQAGHHAHCEGLHGEPSCPWCNATVSEEGDLCPACSLEEGQRITADYLEATQSHEAELKAQGDLDAYEDEREAENEAPKPHDPDADACRCDLCAEAMAEAHWLSMQEGRR